MTKTSPDWSRRSSGLWASSPGWTWRWRGTLRTAQWPGWNRFPLRRIRPPVWLSKTRDARSCAWNKETLTYSHRRGDLNLFAQTGSHYPSSTEMFRQVWDTFVHDRYQIHTTRATINQEFWTGCRNELRINWRPSRELGNRIGITLAWSRGSNMSDWESSVLKSALPARIIPKKVFRVNIVMV